MLTYGAGRAVVLKETGEYVEIYIQKMLCGGLQVYDNNGLIGNRVYYTTKSMAEDFDFTDDQKRSIRDNYNNIHPLKYKM